MYHTYNYGTLASIKLTSISVFFVCYNGVVKCFLFKECEAFSSLLLFYIYKVKFKQKNEPSNPFDKNVPEH